MEGFSVKASSVLVLAALLLSSSSCSTRSLKNPLLPFFPPWPLLWALCAHQGWAFGLASAHPQCSELRPLWLFSHSATPRSSPELFPSSLFSESILQFPITADGASAHHLGTTHLCTRELFRISHQELLSGFTNTYFQVVLNCFLALWVSN